MGIIINEKRLSAHLYTRETSYVIENLHGELLHTYWGKRIELPETDLITPIDTFCSFYPNPNLEDKSYSLEVVPREYPDFGRSDFRTPALRVRLNDGSAITKFVATDMRSFDGKPLIEGLPATYAEEGDDFQTLEITMDDEKTGVEVKLYYTISEKYNTLTRHAVYENKGDDAVFIETALSANVDFYNDNDFELIHFHGSWAREREMARIPVGKGAHIIDSKRGASSHTQNPLVLLARPYTDDLQGEAYAMNLVYSGSFKAAVEVNSGNTTRLQMGINDFDFNWKLNKGEIFYTPEVVMVYSNEGFNGISQSYHRLYRERLCKGKHRDLERPVLVNNWEATYFMFTEEKINGISDVAGELGMELMVLDDGWFGVRNSDLSGLGDWYVNEEKLPNGLGGIADHAKKNGLIFGLWFEPEMISPDSDLFRKHPDWGLHTKGHTRSEGRNQQVLDMSRKDVQDYLIEIIGNVLRDNPVAYVKWDMNRNMTEVNSEILPCDQQGEVTHRYMLGVYRVMEALTTEFEDILFESCAGGGGRFDPGMLYYMPQTWASDNTDHYSRLFIQYGTSFAYPPVTCSSHVSVSPNHQVGRSTDLQTRAFTSMMTNLGYELDLTHLSEEEKEEIKAQIAYYKSVRRDLQFGNSYRLLSPYDSKGTAVLVESADEKRYYLFFFRALNKPHVAQFRLPLVYLSEGRYRAEMISFSKEEKDVLDANGHPIELNKDKVKKMIYPSSFLNAYGFGFDIQRHDFEGQLVVFEKI